MREGNGDAGKNRGRETVLSRRRLMKILGGGGAALALSRLIPGDGSALAQEAARRIPDFTGPGANPYWNSVGPLAAYPQKLPLVLLTDRPVQLETPRSYFLSPFTPNDAFYVRWHLETIPNTVDLKEWRLHVEGNVQNSLTLSLDELASRFPAVTVAAVNQCSGNSRSRLQPRVPGGQWGNGAMGNARWTGAKLSDILAAAGVKAGSVQVQFEGLDRGKGPEGFPSYEFMKSLDLANPVLGECIVAYLMNGAPLPMLNGFPARLVVPGHFATYWVKSLEHICVLDKPDDNFWMKTAYKIPTTPRGTTTPDDVKAGKVAMAPIGRMPVRSFLIAPDGSDKIPAHLPVTLRGIAFSGCGRVTKVEVSTDDGAAWREARLGEDFGAYSFRTWEHDWKPARAGVYRLAVRATDEKGNVQPDEGVWNPGGYLWNKIERQEITLGGAG
jgi:DMSO/TMAO reductase YedYZ molybdopterin-dependent catalytic subunit